jgi:hypothetical protein
MALVCRYSKLGQDDNTRRSGDGPTLGLKLHREILREDDKQCKMRKVGTAHLMEVMNDYDFCRSKTTASVPIRGHQDGILGLGEQIFAGAARWLLVWLYPRLRPCGGGSN